MSEAPIFVRKLLSDKGSYLIDGKESNDVSAQMEYKDIKSAAVEKMSLWSKGLVEVPKWLVKYKPNTINS
jgi:hypothetical protein